MNDTAEQTRPAAAAGALAAQGENRLRRDAMSFPEALAQSVSVMAPAVSGACRSVRLANRRRLAILARRSLQAHPLIEYVRPLCQARWRADRLQPARSVTSPRVLWTRARRRPSR
jgi:hypothetical protein